MPARTHILKHMQKSVLVIQGYAISLCYIVGFTVDSTVNIHRTISKKISKDFKTRVLNATGHRPKVTKTCTVFGFSHRKGLCVESEKI